MGNPITIRDGSVTVQIYPTPQRGYESWTVVYRFGGRRLRKRFSTLEDATEFAEAQARRISNGNTVAIDLPVSAIASFARAEEILRPTGVHIELAASEFAQAKEILGDTPLVVAAREYRRRNPTSSQMLVPELVKEFLATKALNSKYRLNLEVRLERFSAAFPITVSRLTGVAIESWLTALPGASRSRWNHWSDLRSLFQFAIRRRYLAADWEEFASVPAPDKPSGKIQPFSPEELRTLLDYAEASAPKFLPYLAIRAFTGIRYEEMSRLKAEHFHKATGWISMDSHITKTNVRRLVPILPALKAWLRCYPVRDDNLCPYPSATIGPRLVELFRAAGVANRRNGLRDSFSSYRMAVVRDAGKVAEETGHSITIMRQCYREIRMIDGRVITPAAGRRWFNVLPKSVTTSRQKRSSSKKPNKKTTL